MPISGSGRERTQSADTKMQPDSGRVYWTCIPMGPECWPPTPPSIGHTKGETRDTPAAPLEMEKPGATSIRSPKQSYLCCDTTGGPTTRRRGQSPNAQVTQRGPIHPVKGLLLIVIEWPPDSRHHPRNPLRKTKTDRKT